MQRTDRLGEFIITDSTSHTEHRHFASEATCNLGERARDDGGPRRISARMADGIGLRVVTEDAIADVDAHAEPEGWAMMSLVTTRLRTANLELWGILLPEDQDADVIA